MKKLFCVFVLLLILLVPIAYGAKTTSVAQIDEWAAVAQNTLRKGATYDVSAFYGSTLHVDMALTSATAHDGAKIWVQASSNTSGDEDWYTLAEDFGPQGTANPEALAGAEAAGQTVLEVGSTIGWYDDDEARYIFILDNTVADSELCTLVSHVGNTSVTVLDGITNAHDASDTLYDIANTYIYAVPIEVQRIRVLIDNTFDNGGSQVHTRTRISNITGL